MGTQRDYGQSTEEQRRGACGPKRRKPPLAALLAMLLTFGLVLTPDPPSWAVEGGIAAGSDTAIAAASKPLAKEGCATAPGFITLEGRRVLEVRRAPGAQKLEGYVGRGSERLRQLAEDRTFEASAIVVREEAPYSLVGIQGGCRERRWPRWSWPSTSSGCACRAG